MSRIYWSGKSGNGIWKRKEQADSFIELYQKCVDNGAISTVDYDPYEEAVFKKTGKSNDDFLDEDGNVDYILRQEYIEDCEYDLTDKELWELIESENGNAFCQTFERVDEDGELVELGEDDFDEDGNFIY